ncbi:hypothetical protein J8J27_20385, partial [Mycobacterium tuberculosis]|nr:hypothetical protein [Mycobacterium tuberculosis]
MSDTKGPEAGAKTAGGPGSGTNGNGGNGHDALLPQLLIMRRTFFASPMRGVVGILVVAIAIVIIANAYFQT